VGAIDGASPLPEPAARLQEPAPEPEPAVASSEPAPAGTAELDVPDFLPAVLSWPDAERWPAPTLVAAHGAGDSPEMQCEIWRSILGKRGVILCLRGRSLRRGSNDHGFYYANHLELEREALAAIGELEKRHSRHADVKRVVYAGYSQGAQMGLLMLVEHGALAPSLMLIEGGSGDWTEKRAKRFKATGGDRVALICGTPGCNQRAEAGVQRLQAAQVEASLRYGAGAGHTYGGPLEDEMVAAFEELTRGDERWR
jgi:predicted esterase